MYKIISLFIIYLFLFSCTTYNNIEKIDLIEDQTPSNIFITKESVTDYDLTVLKGGSYPEIKNDTPFSEIELIILQQNDGLELTATVDVAHYFKYFLRDKRDLLELWVENSRPNIPYIRNAFLDAELPVELIYLPFLESGYNVKAYSRVGAGGIWQFMPSTAVSYGLNINWWTDERRSPQLATPYAIEHLSYLYKLFDNWYTALAAYNAGEGRISRAMKKVDIYDYFELIKTNALPKETRKYVPQYLAIVKIMKNLELLGFDPIDWDLTNLNTTLEIPGGTDLFDFSTNIDLKWDDFTKLNPSFRRKVSDPSNESTVFIPKNKELLATNYLNNNKPIINNSEFSYYTVKSGDSWWYLSTLTNRSIQSLKRLNNINTNNLNIGQKLLLPGSNYSEPVVKEKRYVSNEKLQTHKVVSGETISSISIRYNIKLTSLYRENNLNSRSILKIGQILSLPGYPIEDKSTHLKTDNNKEYYTVKEGDSIWLIAQRTQVPYKKLLSINNLNSSSRLKIGDKLLLY